MAIAGFNAGAEMAQLRTQQTLAMQSAEPAAAAAAAPVAATATAAAAPAAQATGTSGTADASVAAAAVQEPPATSKIVLQSVLKGAMSGASLTLGLKQFGPLLGKVGLGGMIGTLGKAAVGEAAPVAASGLLGALGKIPIIGKVMPMMAKSGMQGFIITALAGAVVGGIFGAIGGMKKAKAATAEYAEAMAAKQAADQAAADQAAADAAAKEAAAKAQTPTSDAAKRRFKSWVIAKSGATKTAGGSFAHYTVKQGDTVETLAKRFHTTPAEIRKLNPGLGSGATGALPTGKELKLQRKVVPDAKAWVA